MSAQLSSPALSRRVAPFAAVGLLAVAVVHVLDGPASLSDTPYVGALELALAAASVPLAVMLLVRPLRVLWLSAGTLTLLGLLAFLASRTIGLPDATDDIGNWSQTLGLVNLAAETLLLAAIGAALLRARGR